MQRLAGLAGPLSEMVMFRCSMMRHAWLASLLFVPLAGCGPVEISSPDAPEPEVPVEPAQDEDGGVPPGELSDGGVEWDAAELPPDELFDAGLEETDEEEEPAPVDAGLEDPGLEDAGLEEPVVEEPVVEEPVVEEPVVEEPVVEEPVVEEPVVETGGQCTGEGRNPALPSPMPSINDRPGFLHVYVNNVENLKTANEQCRGDWTDLIHYMKAVKPSPDVFVVQQVSNQAQLNVLVERMTNALPGVYAGIIADANPWDQASPCGAEKKKQTNAIIYRRGRLEPIGDKHVWQSWAFRNGECRRNFQARTRNVMQKFRDKVNGKTVTVASLHWSTAQGTGPDPACAKKNMLEADQKLHKSGFVADLVVFGGDMNEPDRNQSGSFRPWYAVANGDNGGALRYRDPVFRMCKQASGTTQSCLNDNWTIGSARRIDFLFAQDRQGCMVPTKRTHTVTFNEGDAASAQVAGSDNPLNYSDHRAIRTFIYY